MDKTLLLNLIMLLVNAAVAFRVEGNKVRCWMPVENETTPIKPPVSLDGVQVESFVALDPELKLVHVCYQWTIPMVTSALERPLPIVEC